MRLDESAIGWLAALSDAALEGEAVVGGVKDRGADAGPPGVSARGSGNLNDQLVVATAVLGISERARDRDSL